jgi:hypothetical protein
VQLPSQLEHLGRSLLGRNFSKDAVFVMLQQHTAYYDEAGGADMGFTFVCGYCATVAQWESFEVDWKLFLIKFGVPYLHMKEFAQSNKCYAAWKGNEPLRARFLGTAAEIIASHASRAFSVSVSHECFDKVNLKYKVRETFSSPYALAGRTCIAIANKFIHGAKTEPPPIEHIFDDGGPDKGGLINSLQAMMPYLPAPSFKPSRDVKPCRQWPDGRMGLVQLQAADYLAYELGKLLREIRFNKGRPVRKSLLALNGVRLDKSSFTEDRLTKMFIGAEAVSPGQFKRGVNGE